MKKLSFILSLFFLNSFTSFSQSSVQQFSVTDQDIREGYVTEKIWLQNFGKPGVQVVNPQYDAIGSFPDKTELKAVTEFTVHPGMERNRPFVFVRIPVYSFNGETRQLQKLSGFELKIDESNLVSSTPKAKTTSVTTSALASGSFYKISVKDAGIYKIDYNFIKDKLGVDPSSIAPSNIRLYGNGGTLMPESNAIPVPDDLVENAIEVVDGGDGKFDQGDYVLFYASGPGSWVKNAAGKTFYHVNNIYEDKSYYFINFDKGAGTRIATESSAGTSNVTAAGFDERQLHEQDLISAGKYGKIWYGEDFGMEPGRQVSRSFSFRPGTTDSATFRFRYGVKSNSFVLFTFKLNGSVIGTFNLSGTGGADDVALSSHVSQFRVPFTGGNADVQVEISSNDPTARGYLDYIEVISRTPLSFSNGQMAFRDWKTVGAGNVAKFDVQNCTGNTVVWDITNPLQPVRISSSCSGGSYSFSRDAAILREYIAFDGSTYLSPEFVKKVDNQNLHGLGQTDFIIVSYPEYINAANKLADFHRQHDKMRVVVATTDQVYNEFSSGSQDIAAIRDFAKMFYKRAGLDSTEMPRYLLLFGDASYDYKDRIEHNTNFVPTYETSESDNAIPSYCSDDFFSFLDDNESIEDITVPNTMDISIGRIPVASATDADKIVDKIINYKNPASLGPWRLSTTIMTDYRLPDEDIHFLDGEAMGRMINLHSNLYNETKVHLGAIPFVSTPGGTRSPDANKMINDQVYKGTFLINYNGHGSITTLSSNRILTQDDFNNWKNADKLPIMITATCEFSKYDDPSYVSAGEQLMMKSDGGAIALLTTTQLVYADQNHIMNSDYLDAQFQQYKGKWPTLGDALRYAKNKTYVSSGSFDNFRKFILLGDPALTPSFPEHKVVTESFVDGNTSLPTDSLKSLGLYTVSGSVKDVNGQIKGDFNGRVYVTIYDKPKTVNLLYRARSFEVQSNIVYKGKATVTNGKFTFSFIAPKDINYNFGKGKISYYAEDGSTDAAGSDTSITIGGYSDVAGSDDISPVVKPFIGDSLFRDGGITGPNTLLYVQLFDESGINVTGNSIGHDLTAVLDDNTASPYVLNDYYETAPNDYKRGYVNFPLSGLSEGKHTLRVKAWDMYNNSGEGVVNFEVINGNIVKLQNLMNYPNPFTDKTHFVFEHNRPGEKLDIQINIYSNSGYLVRTISQKFTPDGSRSNEIIWDGTDNNGAKLPSGLYVYKLNMATDKGIQATAYQKLILIR